MNDLVFCSVVEALLQAAVEFPDDLTVLPDAHRSAERSDFARPEQVYENLAKMAEVNRERRTSGKVLGCSWRVAAAAKGVRYKSGISKTCATQFVSDYTFTYRGERRLFAPHITLGAKGGRKCLSIHFFHDEERRRLVVGHCGRHLRNTRS